MKRWRFAAAALLVLGAAVVGSRRPAAQARLTSLALGPDRVDALREWDARVDEMSRAGDLELRDEHQDTILPARRHERMRQLYHGIPVWGADVARQTERGVTISLFGQLYDGIAIDSEPKLLPEDARDIITQLSGVDLSPRLPQLFVLPLDGGGYALTYRDQAISATDASVFFIDAMDGSVRLRYNLFENQSAVVQGNGVLGDLKKVSVHAIAGTFTADDQLRPPSLSTYDMRGSLAAALNALNGVTSLTTANLAQDPSTTWTDGGNVDAHTYEGFTYDFYFKKFGRRGLDNRNTRIVGMTHPVRPQDIFTASASTLGLFYLNAFYCDDCGRDGLGMMVYGEGGGPATFVYTPTGTRFTVRNFAGSVDVVAHELTHGVTAFSSNLLGLNEAGALNEAFSDMMGSSVEFYVKGTGGNYLMGENLTSTIIPGFQRSLQDPLSLGTPDNYAIRLTDASDNGEVHTNSTIASHAFYLAIEGGTNRTSKLAVTGVGAANREQIEKTFYRGFTQLLPSNATFSMARAATIQAARDLYGAGSNVERAVTQAWTAVGVN
ncbi:MAG TPA: M4 family metallopeptidase [Vicinamibacterales bacterium]|nr:M4 family metallopeptidase [Vicinamibacterales bacterium]